MLLNNPLVSVVIPAFNSEQYLDECLNSILAQSYENIEILLVDDGSTDDTGKLVQKKFPMVRYFYKANGGLASARNFGHDRAKGEYIAWIDADDVAYPTRIASQVEVLQSAPEVILVNTEFDAFDVSGRLYRKYSREYFRFNVDAKKFYDREVFSGISDEGIRVYAGNLYHKLLFGNLIHPPTIMFRSDVLKKVLPLKADLPTSEDWVFIAGVARSGDIAFIDQSLIKYRVSDDQMSSIKNNGKFIAENSLKASLYLVSQDPEYFLQHKKRSNRMIVERYLNVADLSIEVNRIHAINNWLKSLRCLVFTQRHLKLALKIFTPEWILVVYRGVKARARR